MEQSIESMTRLLMMKRHLSVEMAAAARLYADHCASLIAAVVLAAESPIVVAAVVLAPCVEIAHVAVHAAAVVAKKRLHSNLVAL